MYVTTVERCGVTGYVLDIKGQQSVTFMLDGCEFKNTFVLCSLPTDTADLVGNDFIPRVGDVIGFDCSKMSPTGIGNTPRVYSATPTGHMALTILSEGKASRSPQLRKREAQRTDKQVPASLHPEVTMQESKSWLVRATENVTVAPRCRQIVLGRLESEKKLNL
jgi:hypothetical protein